MFETVASIWSNTDDVVKLIGAFALGVSTILTAIGKLPWKVKTLQGGSSRSFQKIRRVENILEEMMKAGVGNEPVAKLIAQMKADQRDEADERDSA